jgi:methionine-rich copper-binding protein CopC
MNIRIVVRTLVLAALLAAPSALSAHMKLAKSEPAADSTVTAPLKAIQVWFSEAPDQKVSKIEVSGPGGPVKVSGLQVVDKSLKVTIDGTAPAGAYTVNWQSAGDDGHVQKGDFKFTLQAAQ